MAANSRLTFHDGQFHLGFPEDAAFNPIDPLVEDAWSHVHGQTIEVALTEDVAAAVGYGITAIQFFKIIDDERREKWFNSEATYEERRAIAISLSIQVLADQLTSNHYSAEELERRLYKGYKDSRQLETNRDKYLELERSLHPGKKFPKGPVAATPTAEDLRKKK
ncbi:MAG: hypothetical protein R3B54_00810 [Bdellovibrionota bacterium]